MPRFAGVPVESEGGKPRFVGVPVEQAPELEEWRRGMLLPMEHNPATGEHRWAVPQLLVEAGEAIQAPLKALSGGYGLEQDPETGRVSPITSEMAGDAMGVAGFGPGGITAPAAGIPSRAAANLSGRARNVLLRGIEDAGIPTDQVGRQLSAIGPDAVLADLSPRLQNQAAAIATMPGAGQKTVVDALRARQSQANPRIFGDVDATLGKSPVPSRLLEDIRNNQVSLGPEYDAAFQGARAVDTSPIALDLDSMAVNLRGDAQRAAQRVRSMLNVTGTDQLDPNPATLFQTRQAIDDMMAGDLGPQARAVMTNIRHRVDQTLAETVPGIKEVDAKFEELAKQREAVQAGQQALDSGRTAVRPSELVDQMVGGSVPQRGMGPSGAPFRLSQGARSEIDRMFGTTVNDLNALKRAVGGEGNWNRDRLATIFGAEKADRLLGILERERRYAETQNLALSGSRTQVLKAAQDEIRGTEKGPGFLQSLLNLQGGSAAAKLADYTLGRAGAAGRESDNSQIARLLMSGADTDWQYSVPKYRPALPGALPTATRALPWYLSSDQ